MHILIGIALAAGLLWLWLSGNPIGWVAGWIVFTLLFGLILNGMFADRGGPDAYLFLLAGLPAFPVSGIPTYWRRWQERRPYDEPFDPTESRHYRLTLRGD